MRSYHSHTTTETNTVTIEPGCGDTMDMHKGPSPGELQEVVTAGLSPLRMADANRREKNA